MKSFSFLAKAAITTILFCSVAGCARQNAGTKTVPVEVLSAAVDNNFAGAPADTQDAAHEAIASLKNHDLPEAFSKFRSLSERQDLTREQRIAASQAFVSTLQQTAAAAANGDAQARQLLKSYMASK